MVHIRNNFFSNLSNKLFGDLNIEILRVFSSLVLYNLARKFIELEKMKKNIDNLDLTPEPLTGEMKRYSISLITSIWGWWWLNKLSTVTVLLFTIGERAFWCQNNYRLIVLFSQKLIYNKVMVNMCLMVF